jgi:hypothetical protein
MEHSESQILYLSIREANRITYVTSTLTCLPSLLSRISGTLSRLGITHNADSDKANRDCGFHVLQWFQAGCLMVFEDVKWIFFDMGN